MKVTKISFLILSLTLFSCGAHIQLPAVHMASIKGNMELLKISTTKENINSLSDIGWTPLMHAADQEHVEAVNYLIKSGADVNFISGGATVYSDRTALNLAAATGNSKIVKLLLDGGAIVDLEGAKNPMVYAASDADVSTIKLLHDLGLDTNARDNIGSTALIEASEGGNLEVIQYLIEQEVDLDAESENGRFALGQACISDEVEVVKVLIEAGAEIDQVNKAGINSLTYSSINGNTEIVDLLIKAGADPHKKINEMPMFLYAFAEQNFETADLLLKHGVPTGNDIAYSYDEVINSEEYKEDSGILAAKPVFYSQLAEKRFEIANQKKSLELYGQVGDEFSRVSQYYIDLEDHYQDKRVGRFFSIVGQAFIQALINVNLGGSSYYITHAKADYAYLADEAKKGAVYYQQLADECFEKAKQMGS